MRLITIPLALAAMVLGAAATDDKVPEATPAGKPLECLSQSQIRESRVRSDQVIDFYTYGGRIYRNTLPDPCPQLGFEKRYEHRSTISQICSVDTITVLVNEGGLRPGATCQLGTFQPVTLVKH
ncbi:MAG: hypothetical protein ACTHMG_11720 [Sphingomonas sp.]